jgi:hypothetical protein
LIRVTRSIPWADECRRDELVLGGDLDLAGRNPEQRLAVDDEPGHRRRRYTLSDEGLP